MRVKFFAGIRDITGTSEIDVADQPADMRALIAALVGRFGEDLGAALVAEDGTLSEAAVILVNGHNVRLADGIATRLSPDDEVAVFPLVSGG